MAQASLAITALAAFAFFVHRWASDEIASEQRLSAGAAGAAALLVSLYTAVAALAAAGEVLSLASPRLLNLVAGGIIACSGLILAASAVRTLGAREVVLGMRVDGVVTQGPYAWSRHPVYLGWTLLLGGMAAMSLSTLAIELAVVAAVAVARVARGEERLLTALRDAEYSTYRRQVRGVAGRRKADAVAAVGHPTS